MVYPQLLAAIEQGKKLFAILIDPDDFDLAIAKEILSQLPSFTTHIFVGGSTANYQDTRSTVQVIKKLVNLPVVIFPGNHAQITAEADALLFLSLISGDNPEYLINQQIKAVNTLKDLELEVIPTGYILIDGGTVSTVQKISGTRPIPQGEVSQIVHTALAGQYSGKQLIYLEAGSGARFPIGQQVINAVKDALDIPLIVGGGIRDRDQLKMAHSAGADIVVVGTAFENNEF
ncbi:MAG: geranylgeranylglyceryl/heptaprenylglyceryl phosphate synthase [Cytophagaceae bacterium]|nr:geranylgeranylglyceryl/heptaprenylglyceryl phosphate synthase [Cytophagaceae bacterium]